MISPRQVGNRDYSLEITLIGSKRSEKQSIDGKFHAGSIIRRTLSFPNSLGEIKQVSLKHVTPLVNRLISWWRRPKPLVIERLSIIPFDGNADEVVKNTSTFGRAESPIYLVANRASSVTIN